MERRERGPPGRDPGGGTGRYAFTLMPQWVKAGMPSPTGRHTFTTWKHWDKDDDLLPSGLIGPVLLRTGVIAK